MKRRHVGCVLIVCISVIAMIRHFGPRTVLPYFPPAVAFSGSSRELQESVVVPTLDTHVAENSNVVWCGTLQLAWAHLMNDVIRTPPDLVGAESIVTLLNRHTLREDDFPPDSYFVFAGMIRDDTVSKVKKEMNDRFGVDARLEPMREKGGVLAFAYLQVRVPFSIPFIENQEAFVFTDSRGVETHVSSFGVPRHAQYAYGNLRTQVCVLYKRCEELEDSRADEFILDLCRDSAPSQIVIAVVPFKNTLSETVDYVNRKASEIDSKSVKDDRFGINDVLLVPNINFSINHRFSELEGADKPFRNPVLNGNHIEIAAQLIQFTLDRSGAEVTSESELYAKPQTTYYVCDRPFLLMVRKRGQVLPFFAIWVDNAELLSKPVH